MNTDGKKLISCLVKKLQDDGKLCTDNEILSLLRSLNRYEVNQIITFGTVDTWERKRIKQEIERL